MPENIRPKHLIFISKAWFYILSQSLIPLSTASDESNIHHHVRHALVKLTHGHVFDFEDCFLRYMVQAAELVHQLKPYAPWLMSICNYGRNEEFIAKHHPKLLCPPVHDTMNIFRQPNDPFATYFGVRQHVNKRNMKKAFQKEVYHFEVGFVLSRCWRNSSKAINAKCNTSLMRSTVLATLHSTTTSTCVF